MRSVMTMVLMLCLLHAGLGLTDDRYDFRKSDAYAKLSKEDRSKLEQVHQDFMMLWGALDRYADEHDGDLPDALEGLVPFYLGALPADPFADAETALSEESRGYLKSKDGLGYRYRRGAPGNRAWCLCSVGLPEFPYLAARGNIGLYMCKGIWISGINPLRLKKRE